MSVNHRNLTTVDFSAALSSATAFIERRDLISISFGDRAKIYADGIEELFDFNNFDCVDGPSAQQMTEWLVKRLNKYLDEQKVN